MNALRQPRTRRPRHGYTLMEVMATVVVLAIVARAAVPSFAPDVAGQLDVFADMVAADLSQVRQLAVANNTSYRLTFETANNRYYLEHTGTNTALNTLPPTIYRHSLNTTTRQYFDLNNVPRLGPSVTLNCVQAMTSSPSSTTTIEFGPLGSTTQSADTVVWMQGGAGDTLRYVSVRVNAVTGLATPAKIDAIGPTTAAGS